MKSYLKDYDKRLTVWNDRSVVVSFFHNTEFMFNRTYYPVTPSSRGRIEELVYNTRYNKGLVCTLALTSMPKSDAMFLNLTVSRYAQHSSHRQFMVDESLRNLLKETVTCLS